MSVAYSAFMFATRILQDAYKYHNTVRPAGHLKTADQIPVTESVRHLEVSPYYNYDRWGLSVSQD